MFQTNPHFLQQEAPPSTWTAPELVLAILIGLGLLLLVGFAGRLRPSGSRHRPASRPRPTLRIVPPPGTTTGGADRLALRDPALQMHAIAEMDFATVPLLNRSEARLYPALERVVRDFGKGHRIMAQTSLGEILRPVGEGRTAEAIDAARFSINAKRLDFAVFNRFGHLVAAVEYQGHGHYHSHSFMRDAVKREALRKAGVPFLELPAEITPDQAAARLAEILAGRSGTA